jgi:hypothetical protein
VGLRVYEFGMRDGSDGQLLVPGDMTVRDCERELHAEILINAGKAFDANRNAGVDGPLLYTLIDAQKQIVGCGHFLPSDGPEEMALLSMLFLGMGYLVGIALHREVTEEQLGAPIHVAEALR